LRQAVLVFGVGVCDISFSFSEFGLAEFHNAPKAEAGLFPKLLSDSHTFVGAVGVPPGISNVTRDVVSKIGKLLTTGCCLKIGDLGASVVQESIENGDVDIYTDAAIPVRNAVVSRWSFTDHAKGRNRGTPKVMFGAAELLGGLNFVPKRSDFWTLLKRLLNQRKNIQCGGAIWAGSSTSWNSCSSENPRMAESPASEAS
jgi:hypothetical protein